MSDITTRKSIDGSITDARNVSGAVNSQKTKVTVDIQTSVTGNVVTKGSLDANTATASNLEVNIAGSTYVYDKNYNHLENKPSINGTELQGKLTLDDIGESTLTNQEITDAVDKMFDLVFGGN